MNAQIEWHTAKALLEWQMELGATEAIGDVPVNRYELAEAPPMLAEPQQPVPAAVSTSGPGAPAAVPEVDPVAVAHQSAAGADDLEALRAAIAAFEHCELRKGARSTVFADGDPRARVMIIGEAPGREEDVQGRPFVGRAGQLLDRMFAAIGMGRAEPDPDRSLYITNVIPWRPPHNREPEREEIAMLQPFVERHVELVAPDILVPMGNIACMAVLGQRGVTRLRGTWAEAMGRPALPMFHPSYLLRTNAAKRDAWADLLQLQARLRESS